MALTPLLRSTCIVKGAIVNEGHKPIKSDTKTLYTNAAAIKTKTTTKKMQSCVTMIYIDGDLVTNRWRQSRMVSLFMVMSTLCNHLGDHLWFESN